MILMPALTEIQLKQFQTVLLNSLEKLQQEMETILMNSTNYRDRLIASQMQKISSGELPDLIDKFNAETISHKISAVKRIDAALSNIHFGMYGLCADCEEDISIEQLRIDATQQRCSTCETKYRKQKYNHYKL